VERVWTAEQDANYERNGREYEELVRNVHSAHPTLNAAEAAFSQRLLIDVGRIVRTVYYKTYLPLPQAWKRDYSKDAEDATSEYAAYVADRVRRKKHATGRSVLGYWRFLKLTVRARVVKEIEKAKTLALLYLENKDGSFFENPAIRHAQTSQESILPAGALETLTKKQRCILAALDAHGNDRGATADYFGMTENAFNKHIGKIKEKMSAATR
jgi:hypothetical protein